VTPAAGIKIRLLEVTSARRSHLLYNGGNKISGIGTPLFSLPINQAHHAHHAYFANPQLLFAKFSKYSYVLGATALNLSIFAVSPELEIQ
jgi:hypothetical protein